MVGHLFGGKLGGVANVKMWFVCRLRFGGKKASLGQNLIYFFTENVSGKWFDNILADFGFNG